MKTIEINIYKAEHCTQGIVEGQLLSIGGTPIIVPVSNEYPKHPGYNLLEFDGHHVHHGEYDGPLWVKADTVEFVRTETIQID